LLASALRQALICAGRSRDVLLSHLATVPVNVGLNAVLGFGVFGLPRLGTAGIALSTTIACWLCMLTQFFLLGRTPHWVIIWKRADEHRCRDIRANLLGLGWPVAAAVLLEVGAFHLTSLVAARFGAEWLGAHVLATQVASIAFALPLGLAQAAAAVSAETRSRDTSCAPAIRVALLLAIGTSAVASILLLCVRTPLAFFLAPRGDITTSVYLGSLLVPVAFFHLGDAVQCVAAGLLRGLGVSRASLLGALGAYAVVAPGLALGLVPRHGVPGIWWALAGAMICAAAFLSRLAAVAARSVWVHADPGTAA